MDRINTLEIEVEGLRKLLHEKEDLLYRLKKEYTSQILQSQYRESVLRSFSVSREISQTTNSEEDCIQNGAEQQRVRVGALPKWAIERYSRQILMPEIGVQGQEKLCSAKVLIVGAGGLGCPAAMYLAGAGVGEIGIVDYDCVEITNIHRQLLHRECDVTVNKAESAARALRNINSRIKITPYSIQLDSSNATDVASRYDIVLDCTDNAPTRYLLNDMCTLLKLPLISGSALKLEGQLTMYGYRSEKHGVGTGGAYRGPCYRCVFPTPPPPAALGSCSAQGVAGPVPGVMGTLQAMEAIKYIVGMPSTNLLVERMLVLDADDMSCRVVQLRPRNTMCAACSDNPTITHLVDYEAFCNAIAKEKKKQDAKIKSEKRKIEKEKRMTGQSYFGFRTSKHGDKTKWIQDVLKSKRTLGPTCNSLYCSKINTRYCKKLSENDRKTIFDNFWQLEWSEKKSLVRSLIDIIPVKRRRATLKGEISRKTESKSYNLILNGRKIQVCRITFLNTLGIKEAMVRCWLVNQNKPRNPKIPIKSLNVVSYIDSLPKTDPKCPYCQNVKYLNIDVKNQFQLYNIYVKDMKTRNITPASRKTFAKVMARKNLRIFKPKNDRDVCDLVKQHNNLSFEVEKDFYYTTIEQWTGNL